MYYRLTTESTFTDAKLGEQILQYLSSLAQSRDDKKTLEEYLLTKDTDTCSKAA
jgi:hypothetical protein